MQQALVGDDGFPKYVAAPKFTGAKQGYYYGRGAFGVGCESSIRLFPPLPTSTHTPISIQAPHVTPLKPSAVWAYTCAPFLGVLAACTPCPCVGSYAASLLSLAPARAAPLSVRRYYRDAKQEPPKLETEEAAEPADERKPIDPEQLLREAEEVAGNLDEVQTAVHQAPDRAQSSVAAKCVQHCSNSIHVSCACAGRAAGLAGHAAPGQSLRAKGATACWPCSHENPAALR